MKKIYTFCTTHKYLHQLCQVEKASLQVSMASMHLETLEELYRQMLSLW